MRPRHLLIATGLAFQGVQAATLEEVIVTGERLARPVSATASSVWVATREELDRIPGDDRLDDLFTRVPNVQVGTGSEGPAIRGQDSTGVLRDLPAFLGGARPRTTLQVDGRDVGFNEFVFSAAPLWDVEQVEVYRSPQTTTQGRNAIGGAIFIRTHDPGTEWEARGRAVVDDQHTRQGSIALSGPLVADTLSFRISGDLRNGRTASRIADLYDGADPNVDRHGLVRLKLLAEPAAVRGFRSLLTLARTEVHMPQIEGHALPFESRNDPAPGYGVFATTVDAATLDVRYRIAPALHTRTTASLGWATIERNARVFNGQALGQTLTHTRDQSIESLLNWTPGSTLQVLGGLHASRHRSRQQIDVSAVLGAGGFHDHQDSLGLFTEINLMPHPRWTLTSGLRHQRDGQDRAGALAAGATTYPIDFDARFNAWLPKFSVAYRAGDTTLGLLAQRAYNPGGTSYDFALGTQRDFKREMLWNYEAFSRSSLAGHRATLDINVFHTRSRDAQRALTRLYQVPGRPAALWAEIHNVPRARTHGAEASLAWAASQQLQLHAGAGWLQTRITRTTAASATLHDRHFQRSPGFSGSIAADWRPAQSWRLSLVMRHRDGYFSDDANTPSLHISAATQFDASIAWTSTRWSVSAYARNLLDSFDLHSQLSARLAAASDPRVLGLAIEARR